MLTLKDVNVKYGELQALHNVSFTVKPGQIVTLLGSNGAGKTTTLRTISGLLRPKSGNILFKDRDITNLDPAEIANLGIAHVPEGRRVFKSLSVLENLEMGAFAKRAIPHKKKNLEYVFQLFPRLYERRRQKSDSLSGGEQQMLAIGRALMLQPEILMLDEPSQGLAPIVVDQVFSAIENINKDGTCVLLVEQNATASLNVAHFGIILENGYISYEGARDNLLNNEFVTSAYLGI